MRAFRQVYLMKPGAEDGEQDFYAEPRGRTLSARYTTAIPPSRQARPFVFPFQPPPFRIPLPYSPFLFPPCNPRPLSSLKPVLPFAVYSVAYYPRSLFGSSRVSSDPVQPRSLHSSAPPLLLVAIRFYLLTIISPLVFFTLPTPSPSFNLSTHFRFNKGLRLSGTDSSWPLIASSLFNASRPPPSRLVLAH